MESPGIVMLCINSEPLERLSFSTNSCPSMVQDAACDCTQAASCTIDGHEFVLNESLSNSSQLVHSITIPGDSISYSFDPVRGLADGSLTMELHTDSRDFKLNLVVNNTGRVVLCSHDAGHAIPGYDVCPLVED